MKVAFLFFHTLSGSLGSVVRVRELMKGLNALGTDVILCSPFVKSKLIWNDVPAYHLSSFVSLLGLQNIAYKLMKNAYYMKSFVRSFILKESFRERIRANFSGKVKKLLSDVNPDILQVEHDVTLNYVSRMNEDTKCVVDLHNLVAEELCSVGVIRRDGEEFRALQKLTGENLTRVDHIIVVSEAMKSYVQENYGVSGGDITVVSPGGKLGLRCSNRSRLPPKVCYAGQVSYREHVDLFIRSIPYVVNEKSDVCFHITNKGEQLKKIKEEAKRLGIKPTYYWFSDEKFYDFLSTCHVGALPSQNDLARKIGTPVKLFDYMSVGVPVVANDIGAWTEIIKNFQMGLVSKDDPRDFASATIELLDDLELWAKCSRNAISLVKSQYNWFSSSAILADSYKKIL